VTASMQWPQVMPSMLTLVMVLMVPPVGIDSVLA
jgi:hypothetical protein